MQKKMIVSVNGRTYSMGKNMALNLIKIAKESLADKIAIVALEKGNFLEMRKDEFKNKLGLNKSIAEYNKKGFLVHYVVGGEQSVEAE